MLRRARRSGDFFAELERGGGRLLSSDPKRAVKGLLRCWKDHAPRAGPAICPAASSGSTPASRPPPSAASSSPTASGAPPPRAHTRPVSPRALTRRRLLRLGRIAAGEPDPAVRSALRAALASWAQEFGGEAGTGEGLRAVLQYLAAHGPGPGPGTLVPGGTLVSAPAPAPAPAPAGVLPPGSTT
eukprot:tig00001222_g7598.t1